MRRPRTTGVGRPRPAPRKPTTVVGRGVRHILSMPPATSGSGWVDLSVGGKVTGGLLLHCTGSGEERESSGGGCPLLGNAGLPRADRHPRHRRHRSRQYQLK